MSALIGESVMSTVAEGVAAVWTDILKVTSPSDEDDFFVSGGDSVKAMIMTFAIGERFGIDLTPEIIFEAPTFGALCALVDQQLAQPAA